MYWGIPPEINAFRLTMMGAGPTAHVPVVAAYTDAAATHLQQAAQQTVTTMATAPSFVGFGGASMVSAATPMSAWMGAAGAHASAAAATVQGAMAGYSTAVASTIPHPVVIENRLREAALVASNILGQNTPAIAEAEAEYGEFWTQNASAMMGYLATTTAAVDALSVPMAPLTDMTDPAGAASGLAGLVSEGIGSGVQALGSGVSAGGQGISSAVGSSVGAAVSSSMAGVESAGSGVQALGASSGTGQGTAGTGTGAGLVGAASASMAPSTSGAPSSAPATPGSPSAPGQGQGGQPPLGDSGQGLLNQVTEMAPQAFSAAESPLSSVAGLPAQGAGQIGGLMGPLSALTSGMSGGLGGGPGGEGPPPLSAANAPWSGLSGANGGYAGGGSEVSAALTKPSAGSLGGPVGLPGGWWANAAASGEDSAGPAAGRRSGAGAGRSAMAPGMYGPMGAVGRSGRGSQHAEVSEADKMITLGSSAHEAPVLTSQGVVHVGQGG